MKKNKNIEKRTLSYYTIFFLILWCFLQSSLHCTYANAQEPGKKSNLKYAGEQTEYSNEPNKDHTEPLRYIITYDASNQQPKLIVNLMFSGDSTGSTVLKVPHSWAWQNDFQKGIKFLKPLNTDIYITPNSDSTEYHIKHKPFQKIEIYYEVVQYWDKPINDKVYYRPIINETYYHFIGYGVFVHPYWDETIKRNISIEWRGIHDTWTIANSFGINKSQIFETSIEKLRHAVYLAGDFILNKVTVKDYPVCIVQRGNWSFTPTEYTDMVKSVVKGVRDFWNDYDFPYFLITLIPTDKTSLKGGTGLTNSFATFVAATEIKSVDELKFLLTHELFHTWNGRKIQRQQPEELIYWFSEGFTNYYTRLILLRNKLITLEEYVSDYNKTIENYYISPAINSTNKDVLTSTHTDRYIEKIPYLRGDLLATKWNALIKDSTKYSLDNVMFDLLSSALQSNMLVSAENIDLLVKKYLDSGIMKDINKFVHKGETIIPGAKDLGPCVELIYEEKHRFDLGFEYKKSKTNKDLFVTKVAGNGPAFQAGLRVGDTIISRSIHRGKPEIPVKIGIKRQNGENEILEYFPLGEKINTPQYRLKHNTSEKHNCTEWFK